MTISDVFYNLFIEMCVLTFLTINWAKHQNITFFKFSTLLFKLLKLKVSVIMNNMSLTLKKVNINAPLKWNPIFKKSSYLGYYFSNIKRWIK